MRHFFWVLKHTWPYRYRLLASVVCALLVAALWSLNLSAIYPVLKILSTDKNLQQWVDEEIEDHQKQLDNPDRRARIAFLQSELKRLDESPNLAGKETYERKFTQEIAKLDVQIGEIKKIREQTQALLERKQVVETLQSNRTEVVHLFDEMIRQLPEGLYLKAIKQTGSDIQIQGYTQSSARVSSLMRNLDASPWFENPRLVEIKSATVNNLRANEFNLTVRQTKQQAEGEDKEKGSQS